MNGYDFFKCHPNYTVVKIILKVSKYIKTLKPKSFIGIFASPRGDNFKLFLIPYKNSS